MRSWRHLQGFGTFEIDGKTSVTFDKHRYNPRNRIEIMFGRLKDRRRVATRTITFPGCSFPQSPSRLSSSIGYE
jgi:hypothetical protein